MQWLIDNWTALVVIVAVVLFVYFYVKKIYDDFPSQEQLDKVRNWLLYAVIEAEKEYGAGTGALKLRSVYDQFVDRFESISKIITFERFSRLVDEALQNMRHLLETNKDIEYYVSGVERFFND